MTDNVFFLKKAILQKVEMHYFTINFYLFIYLFNVYVFFMALTVWFCGFEMYIIITLTSLKYKPFMNNFEDVQMFEKSF